MKIWYVKDVCYDTEMLLEETDLFLNQEVAKIECARKEAARKKSWLESYERNRQKYEIEELARNALDEAGIAWDNTSLRYSANWRNEEYKPMYEVGFVEVVDEVVE